MSAQNRLNLLFLMTAHRQVTEFEYSFRFFRNYTQSNNDFYVHHHGAHDLSAIEFPPGTRLHLSPANLGGHRLGGLEAVCETLNENDFSKYDYVIHLHPDVFVTSEPKLLRLLHAHLDDDAVFLNTHSYPDSRFYDFDFFIFKPKRLQRNIFESWQTWGEIPEYFLHDKIHEHEIKHVVVPRYENDFGQPHRMDLNGVWHEHDLTRIKAYLDAKVWTKPVIAFHRWCGLSVGWRRLI
jgi:hypothetical protein